MIIRWVSASAIRRRKVSLRFA